MSTQPSRTTRALTVASLAALLLSCGGEDPGNGPGDGPSVDPSGINGGGRWIVRGSVSRKGSLVVNGVRFDTTGASITVNGAPEAESRLLPGQVLDVLGDVDQGGLGGQAIQIGYENSLRGNVQQLAISAGTLVVLGQHVGVDLETIYGTGLSQHTGLETLSPADAVIISGFRQADGRLIASRIDRDQAPGTAELIGTISGLDPANMRFQIGALTVDYASAVLDGFTTGLANGNTVRVQGPHPSGSNPLAATHVSWRARGVAADPNDNVNVEGFVTRFASSRDFDVDGQRIHTSSATVFVGLEAAQVGAQQFLDVQGQRDQSGRLHAARVAHIPRADIQIEARLSGVDAAAGTVQLLGVTAIATARTRYFDDDEDQLSLSDLMAGDGVQIAAYLSEGQLVLTRVERDDDGDEEVELEGPVTDLLAPGFRIGGIQIVTDANTEFDDLSSEQFFATAAGRRAEVEGTASGTLVLATEVELED